MTSLWSQDVLLSWYRCVRIHTMSPTREAHSGFSVQSLYWGSMIDWLPMCLISVSRWTDTVGPKAILLVSLVWPPPTLSHIVRLCITQRSLANKAILTRHDILRIQRLSPEVEGKVLTFCLDKTKFFTILGRVFQSSG